MPSPSLQSFLWRSLGKQWREYEKSYRRCRKEMSEKSIHRFRVQCRRLLSTATMLAAVMPSKAPLAISDAVKERLELFARLRDIQVQLDAVEREMNRFDEIRPFRRFLAKRERRLGKRAARQLKRLGLSKVAGLVKAVVKKLEEKPGPSEVMSRQVAERVLKRAFADVLALYRKIEASDTASIHATRVAFKKYRYMTQSLHPRLIEVSPAMRSRMHNYQTRMGAIQDAEVLQAIWRKFLGKKKARRFAESRFSQEIERRRQRLIAAYVKRGEELLKFAPFTGTGLARPRPAGANPSS